MPSTLPDGEPAPSDGRLPEAALAQLDSRTFSAYVHVPFCATRCGYCDFNTYTSRELGGMSQGTYVQALAQEIDIAVRVLGDVPPLSTVFFGGGTPTLLTATDQASILLRLREAFGLAPDCEVTTEANPESVSLEQLDSLREAGVNRISFGMQSAVPHVLEILDRQHTPGRVAEAVAEARRAGFDNISVDLIYGAPGESIADWTTSLQAALALDPDHVSAYALIVEPGTALARRIDRGELPKVDDDEQADKYEVADRLLATSGLEWYEVSNWASSEANQSRHNLAYWRGENWWGFGPGAHSHIGGVRWWNVKHPNAYAERLASGLSPAVGRELLGATAQALERVLLEVRVRDGLPVAALADEVVSSAPTLVEDGLIDRRAWGAGRVVLTLRGRLLADLVVRQLTPR
ncbi:MAG: radical SAM family heme chaperone HemW [Actinomycetes bacterium]